MFVVVAVQAYCQGVSNGKLATGFGSFLLRYWQMRPWPAGSFDGWEHGIIWNHLWYLAYLLPYTVALMALVSLAKLVRLPTLPALPAAVVVPALLVLPILWEGFCVMCVMPRHPPTHALIGDWFVHAESFPLFLLGYLLARSERFWQLAVQLRWLTLVAAVLTITAELGIRYLGMHMQPAQLPPALDALPLGTPGTCRTRGLYLAGAADPAGLGQAASEPAVRLAALLHGSGVPLVHPASEPDHRGAVLVDAAAVERLAGTGAGDRGHGDRLSGAA